MTAMHTLGVLAAVWLASGVLFGFAYFALLRRTVGYFTSSRGHFLPAALTVGRLAAAAAFFWWAARSGVMPTLAAFLGFLIARAVALQAMRRLV